jgi:nucleotide-binding universal stress UspA family protein
MELFRQCPCPVLAVGPSIRNSTPLILAAVNANGEDQVEQSLNKKIIELGLLMAQLERGSLIILQAWTAFEEGRLRVHTSQTQFAAYLDSTHREVLDDLRALTDSFGTRLASTRIEVRKGLPEDVIPQFVLSAGIDLVAMGTVARTGLSGLLIGNTAERILQQLLCSVITIKPDGFASRHGADA